MLFVLFDGDQRGWESNRTFVCLRCCCVQLGEMLDSFDQSVNETIVNS